VPLGVLPAVIDDCVNTHRRFAGPDGNSKKQRMKTSSRLLQELLTLIGGAVLLCFAAWLCGINKTFFSTARSAFGAVILLLACRSLVGSLVRNKRPGNG
jgi:hypothetical protein